MRQGNGSKWSHFPPIFGILASKRLMFRLLLRQAACRLDSCEFHNMWFVWLPAMLRKNLIYTPKRETDAMTVAKLRETVMMTPEAFYAWNQRLQFFKETEALITIIRSSLLVRRVIGCAHTVTGRYPSHKMQCSIQFESQHDSR